MSDQIQSVLKEERVFPPSAEFSAAAHIQSDDRLEQIRRDAARDPEAFWAGIASDLHWFEKWDTVLDWNPPFAKWFVGGTTNVSLQLPRPPRRHLAPQQGGDHLGGRARRQPHPHLRRPAARGDPLRQRAARPGRRSRRPRRHLHADDPGARDRDAGLRAHRRDPQRRVRRLQRRGAARPHQRRAGEGGGDGRRRLSARHDRAAQGQGR